jgi:hypothetical protein
VHVIALPRTDSDQLLKRLNRKLEEACDIHHTTIQIERTAQAEEIYHDPGGEHPIPNQQQ